MTSEREPVDDAALIAEAYRNTAHTASDTVFGLEILRLERTGWQPPAPEPDPVVEGTREILAEWYQDGVFGEPEGDAFKAASSVLRRLLSEAEARGRESERERCADIARRQSNCTRADSPLSKGFKQAADDIERIILEGLPASTSLKDVWPQ